MRDFLSMLNLVVAVATTLMMGSLLILPRTTQSVSLFAACLVWVFCAVRLRRSNRLWPWIGCLLPVSAVSLFFGAEILRVMGFVWRAEYGDPTVDIDPTTIGAPLFGSGAFTVGYVALLVALCSIPAWPIRKEAEA